MKVRALSTRRHFSRDCRKPQGWVSKPPTKILARPELSDREAIEEALAALEEGVAA